MNDAVCTCFLFVIYLLMLYLATMMSANVFIVDVCETASALGTSRTKFDRAANTVRLVCTTGLRFLLQLWFAKRPMLWLPEGLFPGWLEWCLALPRAPKGSISLHVWGLACNSSIQYVQGIIDMASERASTEKVIAEKTKGSESDVDSRKEK